MDDFRESIKTGSGTDRRIRAASLRNFFGAKENVLVPKLSIQNLDRQVGIGWAARVTVLVCESVDAQKSQRSGQRKPRYNCAEVQEIFKDYRPDIEQCRVETRPTDRFDDPEDDFEIIVDVIKLSEYLGQVIAEYSLENLPFVKEQILVEIFSFFGSVGRANFQSKYSSLPGESETPDCAPESCADVARIIAEGRGSSSTTSTDPQPSAASQLSDADPEPYVVSQRDEAQRPSGHEQDTAETAGEDCTSDSEWARKFKNLIRATDKLSAKVILCNITKAKAEDFDNLAKVFLELFIVAHQERDRNCELHRYLSSVSSALLSVLTNSRSQAALLPNRAHILLGTSTQIDLDTPSLIVIDLQNFQTVIDGLHENNRKVNRVTLIAESLQLLALLESGRAKTTDSMEDQWGEVPDSFPMDGEFPPPPPEAFQSRQLVPRSSGSLAVPAGLAPFDDLMGSNGFGPGRQANQNFRYGGPRINLPLLKNIMDIEQFLLKFERVMNHFEIPDRDRVLYLEQCVEGSRAEAWLANYLRNYAGQKFHIVEMAFRKAFCSVDETRRLKAMIKTRVWTAGESVSQYFIDKMVLLSRYSSTMSLEDRICHIKEGLPHNWKIRLVGMTFKTMEDMLDYLVLVEADLMEIRNGAALVEKSVTLEQPQSSAVNALGLDEMRKNFEALAVSVSALRDELKEGRRRAATPGPSGPDRGRDRDRSSDKDRSRRYSRDRSADRYHKDDRYRSKDRYRSDSRQRSSDRYRKDDRSKSRDRYRKDDRYRSRDRSTEHCCDHKCRSRSKGQHRDDSQKRDFSKHRDRSTSANKGSKNERK